MARPRKYQTQEKLKERVASYFKDIGDNKGIPSKVGFRLWLDLNRQTYYIYSSMDLFSDILKRADDLIEQWWVHKLSGTTPTGAIFYLKNAFRDDYKDRTETDITSKGESITPALVKFMDEKTGDNNRNT